MQLCIEIFDPFNCFQELKECWCVASIWEETKLCVRDDTLFNEIVLKVVIYEKCKVFI